MCSPCFLGVLTATPGLEDSRLRLWAADFWNLWVLILTGSVKEWWKIRAVMEMMSWHVWNEITVSCRCWNHSSFCYGSWRLAPYGLKTEPTTEKRRRNTCFAASGHSIRRVESAKYLGVYLVSSNKFRCSFSNNKAGFSRHSTVFMER